MKEDHVAKQQKPAPPYITKMEERGDFKIWIVDGSYIRGHIDEEFTNFGQHFRFPYIPEDELWLDREAEHDVGSFSSTTCWSSTG
jgi:hypothetical protein